MTIRSWVQFSYRNPATFGSHSADLLTNFPKAGHTFSKGVVSKNFPRDTAKRVTSTKKSLIMVARNHMPSDHNQGFFRTRDPLRYLACKKSLTQRKVSDDEEI